MQCEALFSATLNGASRLVLKIGSALLIDEAGVLSVEKLRSFVALTTRLWREGKETLLVTSGAVAAARHLLLEKPASRLSLAEKQALSSVGQIQLMETYRQAFAAVGFQVAQILLSKYSFSHRASYVNVRNTIATLLRLKVIPIINENDAVAVDELRFGDNDVIGALVAGLARAHLYVILSDVEGLYLHYRSARQKKLRVVRKLEKKHFEAARGPGSIQASGGMTTKLQAAQIGQALAVPTLIVKGQLSAAQSRDDTFLYRSIFENHQGTLFLAPTAPGALKQIKAKKLWVLSNVNPAGYLVVDAGAERALQNNKSLLAKGVLSAFGNITAGAVVSVLSEAEELVAKGVCNFNANELKKILGVESKQIEVRLGYAAAREVIHKDFLALL